MSPNRFRRCNWPPWCLTPSPFPRDAWPGRSLAANRPSRANRKPPTVPHRPIWAIQTNLTVRVVDSLLVGAAKDFLGHRHRLHPMLAQERDDLGENRLVHPHVAGFAKPSAHFGQLGSRRRNDADGHLHGAAVIGTIEGDRADRVTPIPRLAFFSSHFLGCHPSFMVAAPLRNSMLYPGPACRIKSANNEWIKDTAHEKRWIGTSRTKGRPRAIGGTVCGQGRNCNFPAVAQMVGFGLEKSKMLAPVKRCSMVVRIRWSCEIVKRREMSYAVAALGSLLIAPRRSNSAHLHRPRCVRTRGLGHSFHRKEARRICRDRRNARSEDQRLLRAVPDAH